VPCGGDESTTRTDGHQHRRSRSLPLRQTPVSAIFERLGPTTAPSQRTERGLGSECDLQAERSVLTNAPRREIERPRFFVGPQRMDGSGGGPRCVGPRFVLNGSGLGFAYGAWTLAVWPPGQFPTALQVGDWAIAVGQPVGPTNTVDDGKSLATWSRNVSQLGITDKRLNLIQGDRCGDPIRQFRWAPAQCRWRGGGDNTLVRLRPGSRAGFRPNPDQPCPQHLPPNCCDRMVQPPMIRLGLIQAPSDQGGGRAGRALVRSVLPGSPAY